MSAELAGVLLISHEVFWPYFAGASLLLIGGAVASRDWKRASGSERLRVLGSFFLAIPMGVFGADHFVDATNVAAIVPSWIPAHLFWVYLVGAGLIASGLSIAVRRHSILAATLLGAMLLSFVVLMHIPNLAEDPHDRFALAVLFRDVSFSAGAFALALQQTKKMAPRRYGLAAAILRCTVGLAAIVFATKHFLHPEYVPVIPLRQQLPAWIPAHTGLAYLTGFVLLLAGVCMLFDWGAKPAATWLGMFVLLTVLLVYLPLLIATPDVRQLNYVVDTLAFSGTALLIAGAIERGEAVSSVEVKTCFALSGER